MSTTLLLIQTLNGLQFGVMLFLMAAGLTLVFGIMNLVNLAHGSLYMMGAYFAAAATAWTGNPLLGILFAIPATLLLGVVVEFITLRTLYQRDHLDQVLCTFGLILFFNELARVLWGSAAIPMAIPEALTGFVTIIPGLIYPKWRLAIILVGLLVALLLYLLISHTRLGMLIRAGASNRPMVGALGVNISLLFTLVFGLGAALAGLAGAMVAPLLSVEPGMGDPILILTFVVIVIGGIGSIRGAFIASLLVGLIDTVGRSFLPALLRELFQTQSANTIGAALASMLIYILMAAVLFFRPRGLFPPKGR
ncbi:branched-chain amino acid ABC transporter permease [Aquibaculum arenosum]|uniref:Branched-chain amino acid ABC transporter permease n=1 Tax=Aquibaculum arenosum TaxID=3032591 RepID=A0ABT5YQT5_9PROT|nr:branched-chain amino acid ABC transporter permease [Fodinicurvata sp. CAU 1616]MDF2096564.1 branched-chain amino acid ABC transporter permease [Fodinicurvata sp. CAU 1616]